MTDAAKALKLATRRLERAAADVQRLVRELSASAAKAGAGTTATANLGVGKHASLIEELRKDGLPAHVLTHYVIPVSRALTVSHADPGMLFTEVCRILNDLPTESVKKVAAHTIDTRTRLNAPKNVSDDLKAIHQTLLIKIEKHHPSWSAWVVHYKTQNQPGKVSFMERQGVTFELTEYPPGHWGNQRDANEDQARVA